MILATAAAVTVMFLIGWHWVGTDPESTYRVVASTAKVMELPDGSVATLNGDARITVEFSPLERRVFLVQGEAHFEVVKNPQRPFLVRAGDVTVRAVGTAFNVRLADNSVEVIVTEGRVRIEGTQALTAAPATASPSYGPPPDCPQLTAGERVSVVMRAGEWPQPVQVVTLVPQEIEQALAWQTTRLVFNETALAAVVEAFNAHNERKLELADEQLRVRTLTGVFRADNLDGFVRLVEASIDVRAERTPSGSFRLHALP
ncbi:MAG: FecR domain-containing protein [Opitutaceae bacterium]